MEKLFGIPMQNLAVTLLVIVLIIAIGIGFLGWRNRLLFRMAVRNIPRRPAQTILIVLGLTLSTTIITAALTIGDTVSGSISGAVIEGLGSVDVRVSSPTEGERGDAYMPESSAGDVRAALAGDGRVDGIMPQVREFLPVTLPRTSKTEARTRVMGVDMTALAGFEGVSKLDGSPFNLASLGEREAVISAELAKRLSAQVGDEIEVVTPRGRQKFTVALVARRGGLAANEARAIVTLKSMQEAMGRPGQITAIEVSAVGRPGETTDLSKAIARDLRLKFTSPIAAGQIFGSLRDPAVLAEIEKLSQPDGGLPMGLQRDLNTIAAELKKAGPTDQFTELIGRGGVAAAVFVAIDRAGRTDLVPALIPAYAALQTYPVSEIKSDLVELANLIGSFITTIFTVLGSFSIIVGLLLIFLVFVLLAASRTSEMGISRAIGMKRGQLVQMFTFEGFVYAACGSLVGVVLGLLTSMAVVQVFVGIVQPDTDGFSIHYSVGKYSLIAAFSLGLLLTAITVAISAYRVSKLNIVVAIRGLAQEFADSGKPTYRKMLKDLALAFISPARYAFELVREWRRKGDWRSRLKGLAASLLIAPWVFSILGALVRLVGPSLSQGWLLIVAGLFAAVKGINMEQAAPFTIGVSMMIVGMGLSMRWFLRKTKMRQEVEDRIAYTFMGAALLVFWSLPFDTLEPITGKLKSNIEMFILSGVWMVAAATWLVIHNADVLLWVLDRTLGQFGKLRPIIKMAVAYPVNARFRTGLTVAMFALVIFTLMVFAILNNLGNVAQDEPDRVTGGYDVRATVNRRLPVSDMRAAIAASRLLNAADFTVMAAQANVEVEARQPGAKETRFRPLGVRIGDDAFLKSNVLELTHRDPKYGKTDREIWDALARDPSLAVVSAGVIAQQQGGFGGFESGFKAEGVKAEVKGDMQAFDVDLRPFLGQISGGRTFHRTVIGVVDALAESLEPSADGGDRGGPPGGGLLLYTGPTALVDFGAKPLPFTVYKFKLKDPSKAADIGPVLETAFMENGMEATSTAQDIKDNQAQNAAFNRLFQGFMGLGLIVGVAALGVISFRAVVERRQSIGMMRALGFRASMIRTQFLIESAFVALLGTAMGLGLGTVISWSIVQDLSDEVDGLKFVIPWLQVGVIVTIALVFSLLMSLAPAHQASKIYPSEALRYE